jgi:hypothetical protein
VRRGREWRERRRLLDATKRSLNKAHWERSRILRTLRSLETRSRDPCAADKGGGVLQHLTIRQRFRAALTGYAVSFTFGLGVSCLPSPCARNTELKEQRAAASKILTSQALGVLTGHIGKHLLRK